MWRLCAGPYFDSDGQLDTTGAVTHRQVLALYSRHTYSLWCPKKRHGDSGKNKVFQLISIQQNCNKTGSDG